MDQIIYNNSDSDEEFELEIDESDMIIINNNNMNNNTNDIINNDVNNNMNNVNNNDVNNNNVNNNMNNNVNIIKNEINTVKCNENLKINMKGYKKSGNMKERMNYMSLKWVNYLVFNKIIINFTHSNRLLVNIIDYIKKYNIEDIKSIIDLCCPHILECDKLNEISANDIDYVMKILLSRPKQKLINPINLFISKHLSYNLLISIIDSGYFTVNQMNIIYIYLIILI